MLIIIGDWNRKVGNKAESNAIEKFEVRVRNEAEEKIDSWISAKPTTCPCKHMFQKTKQMTVHRDMTRWPI